MKTIYLDHNIVHYYVKGFPQALNGVTEHAALEEVLALYPDVRFTVSDWNVVEAARECARSQPRPEASLYAAFFESLRPVFIEGHDTLQRAEIRDLAFAHWNMPALPRAADWMFASYFGQIGSSRIKDILVGFSLRIYLRHLATTSSSLATFDSPVETARGAIQTGIDAYNAGKLSKRELQTRVTREWLLTLLPERDAFGKWIPIAPRKEL